MLGAVGGYYLYRPDFDPSFLKDDDGKTSDVKCAVFILALFICEALNAYQHFKLSEIEEEQSA